MERKINPTLLTDFSWLNIPAEQAARRLLGCEIASEVDGKLVRAKIVEVEAYDQTDEASHTYRGPSERNRSMFKSAGHLYVYFTYGMHHCINIVCGEEGYGSGVLIRAVEPLEGLDAIESRRGMSGINATNGPGKTAQALGITLAHNGHYLSTRPVQLITRPPLSADRIISAPRIGISKAVHELRRYYIANNPYVSRK